LADAAQAALETADQAHRMAAKKAPVGQGSAKTLGPTRRAPAVPGRKPKAA
jgi:hypothetical protein